MATFQYTAVDGKGKKLNGQLEARDREAAVANLRKSHLFPLFVSELKQGASLRKRNRIGAEELVVFSRQFATLIKAGIPVMRGLSILQAQVDNHYLKDIIASVSGKIEAGSDLSDAMASYPWVFLPLYTNMIKAGESSGSLDVVFDRLATYMEDINRITRKVKSAFIYPAVVVVVAISITSFIFLKVIPSFKGIFLSLNAKLPLPTQIIIALSEFLKNYWLFIIVFIIVAVGVLKQVARIPRVSLQIDGLILKMPLFGKIMLKFVVARFTNTLSTLLISGVPILSAIETGSKTVGNKAIELSLEYVRQQVSKGEKFALALEQTRHFAPLVVNLVAIGEETGELPQMLQKIASFYEEEVDNSVGSLVSLIEPMIIVFLGVVIGGIVVALFLPILQLSSLVGR